MTLLELWAASRQPAGAYRPLGDQRRAQRPAGAHPHPAAAAADGDPAGHRPRARPAILRPRRRARHADRLPSAAAARRGAGRQQQDPDLGRACGCLSPCSPPSRRGCSCAPPPACPTRAWASGSTGSSTAWAGCCRARRSRCGPRMSVLALYLNRMFLVRFLVVLFGIIGFATVIDLIDVGPELVRSPEGAFAAGVRYFGLRLPIMLSELMPLAALLAGLLAVADLLRHRELIVVWSIGVRPLSILRMLLPAGLALVAVKFAVDDFARAAGDQRAAPVGHRRLSPPTDRRRRRAASTGCAAARTSSASRPTRSPSARSATSRSSAAATDGILTERIDAASATDIPGGWRLHDVTRSKVADRIVEHLATLDWPGKIDVERIQLLARPPRELGLRPTAGHRRCRRLRPARAGALPDLAASADRRRLRADVPDDAGLRPGPPVQPHFLDRAGVHGRRRHRLHAPDLQRRRQRPGRGRPDPPRAGGLGATRPAGADRAWAGHARRLARRAPRRRRDPAPLH